MNRLILFMSVWWVGMVVGMYSPWIELDEAVQLFMSEEARKALYDDDDCVFDVDADFDEYESQEDDQWPLSADAPSVTRACVLVQQECIQPRRRMIAHKLVCDVCKARFAHSNELSRHKQQHGSAPMLFACTYCRALFSVQEQLIAHVAAKHWFVCPLCPEKFLVIFHLSDSLKRHITSVHVNKVRRGR